MAETKRTGKAALRGVDGRQATGMCHYTIGVMGSEFNFSVQIPNGVEPQAVLQFGPARGYLCRPPVPVSGPVKCAEAGIMAVWVTDGGKPVLFGMVGSGPFDSAEARRHLANNRQEPSNLPAEVKPSAAPPAEGRAIQATAAVPQEHAVRAQSTKAHAESALRLPPPPVPQKWPVATLPLVVKRAPRPTPQPPVYSPLWDDVSAEFEKMLEYLPKTQPFNGNATDAEIAELPTDGAVQCYVGSVTVNGMKIFLQAVPARPYSRPAGFDHSLVSRDGECYWVKYFIQNS